MDRDDIIKMAREAGCKPFRSPEHWDDVQVFATPNVLERFAALVAANEREACAKVVEQIFDDLAKDNFVDSTAVANLICNFGDFVGKPLIEAIRARGEK